MLNDLMAKMKEQRMCIFDCFSFLDVNKRGGLTKLELKTGL